MRRPDQPDFLLIGAPKAGTTALHAALARHPDVFVTSPKEPKYWLCDDAPPPAWRGPGDAHSQREWVWRRGDYEAALRARRAVPAARGEHAVLPLVARRAPPDRRGAARRPPDRRGPRPVDRAYSNWMHLWSDGLEPVGSFEEAFALQDERVGAGWAPFWRYRDLGRYGEQLAHLYRYVDPARVLVLRYRDIVDEPVATVDRACRFLGLGEGLVDTVPRDNSRDFVTPGWRPQLLGPVVRAGARPAPGAAPRVAPGLPAAGRAAQRPGGAPAAALARAAGTAGAGVRRRRRPAVPGDRPGLRGLDLHAEPGLVPRAQCRGANGPRRRHAARSRTRRPVGDRVSARR